MKKKLKLKELRDRIKHLIEDLSKRVEELEALLDEVEQQGATEDGDDGSNPPNGPATPP